MTFEELLEQGRKVARNAEDCGEQIRGLARDPRFAALLGWLEMRREQFVEAGCEQKMAPHHGTLAHCAGSVFAHQQILHELRHLYEAESKKRHVVHSRE